MKRKDIKELLNKQLDEMTPDMSDRVRRAPLEASKQSCHTDEKKIRNRFSLPKWAYAVACAVLVVVIAATCGIYYAFKPSDGGFNDIKTQIVCYTVDINPSISITADAEGKIVSISSQNQEGDVVLASQAFDDYKNMSVSECINTIIEQSAKLGYIDCYSKSNKVTVSAVGNQQKVDSLSAIADSAQNFLRRLNVFAYVDTVKLNVENFVNSKGWAYNSANLDDYLEQITAQSKFVKGAQYEGDFQSVAEKYVEDYYTDIMYKKTTLDTLGKKLDEVEEQEDIATNYWIYKTVEGTLLAPSLSKKTLTLIKECDAIIDSLETQGISLKEQDRNCPSYAKYAYYVAKYGVAEELAKFFDDVKEFIFDSEFFKIFLSLVNDEDLTKFQKLQQQIECYYNEVISKIKQDLKIREDKYLHIFQSRPSISDKEYDEYLNNLNNYL